ncbi:MAG TPA: type II toxin-antitoxin system prevent-host-death family antitoxin [Acidimicrobiales bacterium]|nr:type II toxin-antitoxin system prevent-host-death family antitoxin [Acidimicrobiales bacterium]
MPSVGVRELSHHTSRHLARVKAGHSLEVTEHGRVIAVITPVGMRVDAVAAASGTLHRRARQTSRATAAAAGPTSSRTRVR